MSSNIDFSKLLAKKTSEHKPPPALPAGVYPAVIRNFKYDISRKNNTPLVQFQVSLTGWPDEIEEEEKFQDEKPIDLSKKSFGADFYLTDEAHYRLSEFLASLFPGDERSEEELVQASPGSHVLADISNRLSEKNKKFYNNIERLVAAVE